MASVNENLDKLSKADVERIREEYLKGWHDLSKYGFRLKGFNHKCSEYGFQELNKSLSDEYRMNYIVNTYSYDEIKDTIENYILTHLVGNTRWQGIELFDCRFGREYARLFKRLLGNREYRKLSEKCRVIKLTNTQIELYGGIGLASNQTKQKAQVTSSKSKRDFLAKAVDELNEHGCVLSSFRNSSVFEVFAYKYLLDVFDKNDVLVDYGVHPYDKRYPFPCDFYIKSLDLFIELNAHFTHGGHWFDEHNNADSLRRKHLSETDRCRNRKFLDTWCRRDVEKRQVAKNSNINYMVFWDGTTHHQGNTLVPNLKDLRKWLNDYNGDFKAFINDYPMNTY